MIGKAAFGISSCIFLTLLIGLYADSSETCKADGSGCSKPNSKKGKVNVKKCSLDIDEAVHRLVPSEEMTIADAVKHCKKLSGCRATSAEVGDTFDAKKVYTFEFLAASKPCVPDNSWRTVVIDDIKTAGKATWSGPPSLEDWRNHPDAVFLSDYPPVIEFPHFLSHAEADYIIKLATPELVPSTIGMAYGTGDSRSSMTGWLGQAEHQKDKVLIEIDKRITNLTNVQSNHMEPFQVVRYEDSQEFVGHQDWLEAQSFQACGGRIATFFMYLNDVESGGQTEFPVLNLKVQPRKGKAILWYNVDYNKLKEVAETTKNFNELIPDDNAEHAALPVEKGQKWIVNRWLHPHDFMTPYMEGLLR